jgi:hypothetical protein
MHINKDNETKLNPNSFAPSNDLISTFDEDKNVFIKNS